MEVEAILVVMVEVTVVTLLETAEALVGAREGCVLVSAGFSNILGARAFSSAATALIYTDQALLGLFCEPNIVVAVV